ncbi:MAG: C4-type zinc ribbon domain-containing protein [Bacteroidaceae bacterium]|nr:C4-type zinc ribbon domain-containing protein [Bacteroidaceae bacterium]
MTKEIKKDPSEYSVEEKLKSLYQLQTVLSKIDEIRTLRGELPLEVQDLEDEVVGLTTRIENYNADIVNCNKGIKEHEHNIEATQAKIAKFEENQNNVRNNREFDALNKEIEFCNLEIELSQKKIREFKAALVTRQEEVEESKALLAERRDDLERKKIELEEIVEETRKDEEHLRDEAKVLEGSIDPRLLLSFKRIRKNTRNGLGIVYVERDACGGCFNKIPPQRQLDIRMRKKIIVCEYCGRIMVDPELAGVQVEAVAEPVKKRSSRKKAAEE